MIIKPSFFSHKSIKSLQTTRQGGQSAKPYDSMNLSVFNQDENAQKNLSHLTELQNLPHNPTFMKQAHTNKVVEYNDPPQSQGIHEADACFTRGKNIICAILTADCLPVLMADDKASVVAAVHCGWRGLYTNILSNTFEQLKVSAKDLNCWLGPCISYKPYTVDEEFRQKFVLKDQQYSHCFYHNKQGGWHADLKRIAVHQLKLLGIESIAQSPYCTYDNKSLFYSYRREGETGRMASLIWLE